MNFVELQLYIGHRIVAAIEPYVDRNDDVAFSQFCEFDQWLTDHHCPTGVLEKDLRFNVGVLEHYTEYHPYLNFRVTLR